MNLKYFSIDNNSNTGELIAYSKHIKISIKQSQYLNIYIYDIRKKIGRYYTKQDIPKRYYELINSMECILKLS